MSTIFCVLFHHNNCLHILCSEHMSFLMTKYPTNENDEMWLKNKQNETFPKWFRENVLCALHNSFVHFYDCHI